MRLRLALRQADRLPVVGCYVTSIITFLVEHKTLVFIGLGLFLIIKAAGYALGGWI
ncbi:hypothetical protein [Methylobacterium sp. R2-1]|uniref:hypothetical protein n=1 Tax=Methylobacterium sp. R2-1 TaxID=2587064 RepID=UPI0016125216|nr:hypothetical protein [Methylobacterium sp. R2-1]MBB2961177.1 hypothetical protein [Methylobacterium sp. R2-1]